MTISSAQVRELREKTGAGMMDCKKALQEVDGKIDSAIDWLRKQGLSSAAKKADRATDQGLVTVWQGDDQIAIVEVNSETDFVARTSQFMSFTQEVCKIVATCGGERDALLQAPMQEGTVEQARQNLVSNLGENIQIRRCGVMKNGGCLGYYIHNSQESDCGTLAVAVSLSCQEATDEIQAFAKNLAMHLAASAASAITTEALDPALIERERTVLLEQIVDSGKPPEIAEKMLTGRMKKFYKEVVLLEQDYVMDTNNTVGQAISELSKKTGQNITVTDFARYALGES